MVIWGLLGGLMLGALMGWTLQLVVRAMVRKEWAALHERDRRVRRAAKGSKGEMAAPAVFGATAMPPGAEPLAPAAAADWPAHMPPLPPAPPNVAAAGRRHRLRQPPPHRPRHRPPLPDAAVAGVACRRRHHANRGSRRFYPKNRSFF